MIDLEPGGILSDQTRQRPNVVVFRMCGSAQDAGILSQRNCIAILDSLPTSWSVRTATARQSQLANPEARVPSSWGTFLPSYTG